MFAAANISQPNKFDDSYFDYRKDIKFDLTDLKFYYPYYRFLNRYFDNMVFSEYGKTQMDKNSFEFNHKKIQLIDSLVTSDSLKNNLLRLNAYNYLINAKNAEEEKRFFETFKKMNTNEKYLEEIDKLAEATLKLKAGNTIPPNILLVSTDNVAKDLQSIIKSPSVLYFWSGKSEAQYKNIHNRAAELKSKYPEYNFIGINTDRHFKKWRETVNKVGYDPSLEFQLENVSDAEKKLVLSSMSKAIILDKNSVILDGNTNMFNANFEGLLLGYLNR
jgi:hypothetical protein